jgi:uncharacterized membrane protein
VFAAVAAVGVAIRHAYNRKGKGQGYAGWLLGSAVAGLAIIGMMAPAPSAPSAVAWAEVAPIVQARCQPCHAAQPTWPGFVSPPAGLVLTDEAHAEAVVAKIKSQVEGMVMPLGNLTGLTDEERARLVAWATR